MRRTLILIAFVACPLAAGCGAAQVSASGQLVKDGQPYHPTADEYLTVNLVSERGDLSFSGKVKEDGTFQIESKDGNVVPKGVYKVSVLRYRTPGASTKGVPEPPTTHEVPDTWDVGANNTLTIDVGKIGVGKDAKKK